MGLPGMAERHAEAEVALGVREHVALAPYTTFNIGGPARWFVTAHTEADIVAAVAFAQQRGLPLFVLGGGSNLLVSDQGFPGLVLHIALMGVRIDQSHGDGTVIVTAAAGENWDSLVQYTVDSNLQGMECLAGIPGAVGGTPVQNVGAYGQEIAQTFASARCFDTHTSRIVDLHKDAIGFAYRTSLLNATERGRYVISEVSFALTPGGKPNLSYADLARAFPPPTVPTLAQVAQKVRSIRRAKGMVVDPNDPDSRSAGSFFRNPIVPAGALEHIAKANGMHPDQVPHWPAGQDCVKLPAAWLLEHAGFLRGTELGRAGVSSKHTLALVNRGGATERDIAALRDRIAAGVRQKFGVVLQQEPENVG